jgi:hypothetical protein
MPNTPSPVPCPYCGAEVGKPHNESCHISHLPAKTVLLDPASIKLLDKIAALEAELTECRRARVADSEIIGREMSRVTALVALADRLTTAIKGPVWEGWASEADVARLKQTVAREAWDEAVRTSLGKRDDTDYVPSPLSVMYRDEYVGGL